MDEQQNVSEIQNISNTTHALENETKQIESEKTKAEEIARMMYLIGYMVIFISGNLGNLLAFLAMRRGSLRNVSTCFYMSILAMSDTCFLWSGTFADWLGVLTYYKINMLTYADCKVNDFFFYFSAHYSSSLLVIMSIEKFIALYFPLKTRSICTVKTARWVSFTAGLIMAAWNFQQFFIKSKITEESGATKCEFLPGDTYLKIRNRINSIVWAFGPFAIMSITNSAIIFKFMMARRLSNQSGTESTSQALSKNAVKGTAMLITISVTFILLTATSALAPFFGDAIYKNHIGFAVAVLLQYSNHSINAVLYCISGSRFRAEVLKLLCFCRKSETKRSTLSTSSASAVMTNVSEAVLPQ